MSKASMVPHDFHNLPGSTPLPGLLRVSVFSFHTGEGQTPNGGDKATAEWLRNETHRGFCIRPGSPYLASEREQAEGLMCA